MGLTDIRIWLGATGTGKSLQVVQEMQQETQRIPIGAPIFWVVPDDVAFAAEQMLTTFIPAALRPEVITMSRLADRLRETVGRSGTDVINATGKRLLLAFAYHQLRDTLGPLKRAQANTGFYQMVIDAFDEMSRHQVDLSALQGALEVAATSLAAERPQAVQAVGRSLLGKLRDLCRLYIRYRELLAEHHFFDPVLTLTDAADALAAVPWLTEAQFYFDGFTVMTPQQIEFCKGIAQRAQRCTFVLPLTESLPPTPSQAAWPHVDPLAAWLQQTGTAQAHVPAAAYTFYLLTAALEKVRLPWRTELFAEMRRFAGGALQTVEQSLRGIDAPIPAVDGAVEFWQAADEDQEALYVAEQILAQVEKGAVDYRDIAVLVPALATDGPRLAAAFQRFGIPYAMDEFPPLAAHPLGRFCLAALRTVVSELSTDAMARLLRTTYCPLREADRDWLDVYLRQYEVAGEDAWFSEEAWHFAADRAETRAKEQACREDERAERLRRILCKPLIPFVKALSHPVVTPQQLGHALWQLLTDAGVKEQVAAQVVDEGAESNPLQASQHEQAWQQIVALLNDLHRVRADAMFLREELVEWVTDVLMSVHQTTIPGGVNQVFVQSFAHAHTWTKAQVYVLGLDERTLPAKVSPHGLLQDEERVLFQQLFGVPLGFTTDERLIIDRQIPYQLFTRASHRLICSFAGFRGGVEQQPSPYFSRLLRATGQELTRIGRDPLAADQPPGADVLVLSERAAIDFLVQGLAQAKAAGTLERVVTSPHLCDAAAWFAERPTWWDRLCHALRGFEHQLPNGHLDKTLAARLYGAPLRTSVQRLEMYAACPYRHFIHYGLGVDAVATDLAQAAEVGNLLHDTVFALLDLVRQGEVDLAALTETEVHALASRVFTEQLAASQHAVFQQKLTRQARAFDLQRRVEAIAELLWLQARQGQFQPWQLEWSFGLDGDDTPPFSLPLADGETLEVRGRIDRLDVYRDGETTWFRIFDYKSGGGHQIDPTKVYYGLQLQLLLYAAVAAAQLGGPETAQPAGVFYMPLLPQPAIADVPQDAQAAQAALRKLLRANGYMHLDDGVIEAMDQALTAGGSELFGAVYKQNGELRKGAKVWSRDEWSQLLRFTLATVRRLATRLRAGQIAVRPYFYAHHDRACTNCALQAVCHFEPADHAKAYRVLTTKRLTDIVGAANAEEETN